MFPFLTISINVHSTGISLSIVVSVCLIRVAVVGAVVTAVAHIIAVVVVLPGIVHERTIVLFGKEENAELNEEAVIVFYGAAVVISTPSL